MAKDLPYFKFFCSEWSDGDITLESYEAQGLFINICAYYWSNECIIELSKLKKKFKGYDAIIDELISSNIIKIKNDYVSISFLDEQKIEREKTSKQNSKNISDYWEKKRTLNEKDTSVSISNNESDSIKKREEERRKDISIPTFEDFFIYAKEKEPSVKQSALKNKYDAWIVNNWRNGNDKPIKNWKSALLQTLPYIEKEIKKPNNSLGV